MFAVAAAEETAGVRVVVAALVCEIFRDRLLPGVTTARVLSFQAGRSPARVTVTLTAWPSSECVAVGAGGAAGVATAGRRAEGVAEPCVRRLAGRIAFGISLDTSRVPNFAFADDSLP